MYYNKVEICGVNTSKLKTLTDSEKDALLLRVKNGDSEARRQLVDGNLRLVLSIVSRFSRRSEEADDLFQVGCIGLIKAVDNFNTDLGLKFSTYAVPMIIGEVRRYLRDNNIIRVSRSVRDLAYRALSAREILSKKDAGEPGVGEITKCMNEIAGTNESEEAVVAALEAIAAPISLFDPVYSDGGTDSIFVMDQISDTDNTDEAWLENIALREAMSRLGNREKEIIDLRFFKGKTQMEIASEIGISQAQVSRLESGAIERIKRQM